MRENKIQRQDDGRKFSKIFADVKSAVVVVAQQSGEKGGNQLELDETRRK